MVTTRLHGMQRFASRQHWLILTIVIGLQLTQGMARRLGPIDQEGFVFTESLYNATIRENSMGRTYVTANVKMGMFLKDPTLDIRYRIISGDGNRLFKPESRRVGDFCFLLVRTRTGVLRVINRERQEKYVLTVKAIAKYRNGPTFTAQTQVTVLVLDENDLSPLFYPYEYKLQVREDTPTHKSILQVTASDADVGVNGEVYYYFAKKVDTFAIHPTSGVVTLTRHLNYIEQNYYELQILAEDRGAKIGQGAKVSRANLQVRVIQVNFHAPVITVQMLPAVVEHSKVGTVYAILYVTDKDIGTNGQILKSSVRIIDGDPHRYFTLQPGRKPYEFNIVVARNLDREITPEGYNLTIRAQDSGNPPKTSIAYVLVKLADTNDNAPVFKQFVYQSTVEETVPVNTPLLFVKALDTDLGQNAKVMYTIEGDEHGWFKVDPSSGLISTKAELDTEVAQFVEFRAVVEDLATPGVRKGNVAVVQINVTDCNDNSPVFNNTKQVVSVAESMPIGTEVYRVSAYDLDKGENGYISYSITNMEGQPFRIDHFSGMITTSKILDYESMKRVYNLRIRASDWGRPYRRESEMTLKVRVRDINDNKPQFEKVDCIGYLSREAPIGTELVVVSAIDFDAGNIISYRISSGNEDNCFEMLSSTGVLKLKCSLKKYTNNFRSIFLTATDGKNLADPTSVNITLVNNRRNRQLSNNDVNINCRHTDVTAILGKLLEKAEQNNKDAEMDGDFSNTSPFMQNIHTPEFPLSTPKIITVSEGISVGHQIVHFNALDDDSGYNGRLSYVISSGDNQGTFKVDTDSGELIVMSPIDREKQDKYALNITVFDMGQPRKSSSVLVNVDIEDVNDFAPEFTKDVYEEQIVESTLVNTSILTVSARDHDLGRNADITYFIETDTQDFTIGAKNGVIKVSQALDREKHDKYELRVKAVDGSLDNPLSSLVTVVLTITDVNDNAPRFLPELYHVRIREDLPVGAVVMIITAHDPDVGSGGVVRYTLQDGMDDKFEIDRQTGTIRITNKLDFEQKQKYNITARARDRGQPTLFTKCQVTIEVIDVNENLYPPKFTDFVFRGLVKENQPRNTTVLQIMATDDDKNNPMASSRDREIKYSIVDGSGLGRFSISTRGIISTNEVLDRESTSHYWLTVIAQDHGAVPLQSRVEVYIEVQDVNDNIPQTNDPVYYPSVLENSKDGTSVLKVVAYDLDDSATQRLSYAITSGNPQGFFSIDFTTGLITTTKRRLDREKQEEHILEVTVSDNGVPALSSTTRVVVSVTDVNDITPRFTERLYHVRIPETKQINGKDFPFYRVLALDDDIGDNGDIDYSLKASKGNGRFRIHPKNGVIYSLRDFEKNTQYDLQVKAVDNGRPQKRGGARIRVTVVERPTHSPLPPKFVNEAVSVNVMENDIVGHLVYLMSAVDKDSAKLWYSIVDGNEDETFTIDIENGNILLASALDWETRKQYNLTVAVTDGVNTQQTWVYVNVLDINDNRPQFSQGMYTVDIFENTAPGTDILTVAASDLDEDKRLFYTIHSSINQASRGKFKINSETDKHGNWTGVITTTDSLNREAIARHELTIMVRDQGTPSKRSLARVIINIKDHNDHEPEFLSKVFDGRVFETAALGTSVVQVMAVDRDKGKNAEIKYSIVSGNVGNTFTIDGELGIVSVAKSLDRRTQAEYTLVVMASDGGSPSLTSTVNVRVYVTISNNAPPKFGMEEYTTELYENGKVGAYAIAVSAVSRSSVVYEIKRGNEAGFFRINPNSGIISTKIVFDYEAFHFFNLTVRATNMVNAFAEATVLIHIIDENDNRPVFTQKTYVGTISEASLAGSVVLDNTSSPLVVKATDDDTNLNALLIYSIVESAAQSYFAIDSNTGAIRTKVNLDHEVANKYEFTVQVTDMGTPRLSAEVAAKVIIHVSDVNDSPPEFTKKVYNANVLLPTYHDVAVITVHAVDRDSEINSELAYSISSGNHDEFFHINSKTGTITINNAEYLLRHHQLSVKVTDGKFSSTADVKVKVEKTKDSGLSFSEKLYQAKIVENRTGVERVTVVQATGHDLNEHLEFSILNPNDMFQIGKTSGVVQTTGVPFDRERQFNYTIVVAVRDKRVPPRVAHVLVNVEVLDTNDNAPVFVNQPYYAIVSIDAAKGDIIRQVVALDADIGQNGVVEYSLVNSQDSKFMISKNTGQISLKRPLDLSDQNKEYSLIVEATDKGEVPHKTQVVVPITIMNKATPVFESPFYTVSVPENIRMHSAVISIQASSPDNRKLIYSISKGDIYGEFAVDFQTDMDVLGPCYITVADELDYEMRKRYDLTVRATDTLTGSYAEAIVHVHLEDVNDKAPSFESLMYTATVSEAVPIGTSILTVVAKDLDSGINAKVRYHMEAVAEGRNDSEYFHLDLEKGIILTKRKLDHELTKKLQFMVIATDSGIPVLSSSVMVTVLVTDLNDNAPRFDQPAYECTITDQVKRGQFVTMVTASDSDSSDEGNLAYSLVGGNDRQAFTITEHNGMIGLSSLRKPVLKSKYTLNVSVTDGVFTNFARVKINVRNSNNHVPQFTHITYDVEVAENLEAGKRVAKVSAVDRDQGKFGAVSYRIDGEDIKEMFRVDRHTGDLFIKKVLDREEESLFRIPIIATDGGGRSGYAMVRVTVTDEPDSKPHFRVNEYKANIYSSSPVGTSVLQVAATDADLGKNGDVEFSIYDGDMSAASKVLTMDSKTGVISTKKPLQGMANQSLQFFVHAVDKGIPSQENDVPVSVYIMGDQDYPPRFEQDSYSYFIPEDKSVDSIIATVTAESNETLTYSIVPGDLKETNMPATFSIDEEGKIRLVSPLDRETTDSFRLMVKAETKATPSLVDYTLVTIQVMDVNDNSPKFESSPYVVTIAENAEVGSKVIQLIAHDKDTGANGDVSYAFMKHYRSMSNIFSIDSQTGWIATLVKLDRETTANYTFDVVAKDRGALKQMTDTVSVQIQVTDHNDEPPVFSHAVYKGAVNEDALPGTVITSVMTSDRDLGSNAEVRYYITGGDLLGQFNIRSTTGEVYVNKPLDRERKARYDLTVSATDGAFESTSKVVVDILDANDNSPVCEQPMYQAIVPEKVPSGSFIVRVTAKDEDERGTRNSRIQYTVQGRGSHMFKMHRKSGILTTMKPLDREKVSDYHLTVLAKDGGGLSCSVDVYVTVSDVNDNAPKFTKTQYTVAIPENAEVNTLLTRVSAADYDLGINRKVRYAMKSKDKHFRMDPVSGIVSLAKPLDREEQPKFNLSIKAVDSGTPQKSSLAYLVVLLLDVNDNPPEFEQSTYTQAVPENTRVGTSVMRVFATSKDTGINAEITYSIVGGNDEGRFRVDSKTGAISVILPLDFEDARGYFLTVQASDGGTPVLSNTAVVKINVTDANDNPPIFLQQVYNAKVREDTKPEDSVVQVQASDLDSAPNGQMTYSIVSGDERGQFAINRKDGYISVKSMLDRETVPTYTLEVQAVDSGHPRMTGTATVNLEVTDANDNAPKFTQDNYTAVVQVDEVGYPSGPLAEDMDVGYRILKLEVTDDDIEPNAAPFSFDIVGGNQDNEFRIDRQGILTTAAKFNRHIKNLYELTVRVFDNGNPPLHADTYIQVTIIEESAYPPRVLPLEVTVSAYNDDFPGGVIGRVKASDQDVYDKLTYSIVSNNQDLFDIHSMDGTIKAVQGLDAGYYVINVSVSDGKYSTFTGVKLTVTEVSDDVADRAVIVRFKDMLPEEFISSHRRNFFRALRSELTVRIKDIHILSIQPGSNKILTPSKHKRSTDSDLDILFAVRKSQDTYFKGNALQHRISRVIPNIENQMGVQIVKVFSDVCTKDMCGQGTCKTHIYFMKDQMFTIISDTESYVSARHALGYECHCKAGYGGLKCEQIVNQCSLDPCPKPKLCKPEGSHGYKCDCPLGKTGDQCDQETDVVPPACTDMNKCPTAVDSRPLTFNGNSYARWRLAEPMERRLSLALELKTVQRSARLMHAVGRVDYSILEIVDGLIQYRFDCGSGEGLVRVNTFHIHDGQWHTIVVERRGNTAEILIDSKYHADSSAPGTNDVLNLDSNDIYFGAEVENLAHGKTDIRRGFEGCMRKIRMDNIQLPFSGSTKIAILQKLENLEFHCRGSYVPGICSSRPCKHGGICIARSPNSYECQCQGRFIGARCEVDTNPCASSPCMHGGVCENLVNDFRCKCKGRLEGKRCDYGFYCKPNPCRNGGICVEGKNRPICNCKGFEGEFCEHDVNECRENPCKNGGTCHNTLGSFTCTCGVEAKGDLCENPNLASITSSGININPEEIIGIAVVVLGLIIVVTVFVVIVRWRRRKRRQRGQRIPTNRDSNDFIYNCDEIKRGNKISNINNKVENVNQNIPPSPCNIPPSPRPPPVPNRPASYTPSTCDSVNTLNNFDTVRNYGSAADELENIGNLPHIEIPEFLQNLDMEKDLKKQNKHIPSEEQQPLMAPDLQGSLSSLPISESEDDLPGYHWDTSDWAPNPALPNITEVPMKEVLDSGTSSPHSNDSNTNIIQAADDCDDDYIETYPDTDYMENDSEYVGDSEYCENECEGDDFDDPNSDFPDPPNFQEILAMQGDLNYDLDGNDSMPRHNYHLHPNEYLPAYDMESSHNSDQWEREELNGNDQEGDDVVPYGFPRPMRGQYLGLPQEDYGTVSDYNDYEHSTAASAIDNMSVSMGGYDTSTNASCSDISGLCEIEDSEINSDEDSDNDIQSARFSHSHIHTQV